MSTFSTLTLFLLGLCHDSFGTSALLPNTTSVSPSSASAVASSAVLAAGGPIATFLNEVPDLLIQIETAVVTQVESVAQELLGLPNPELKYSYGQSPPVYPAPIGNGQGNWTDAYNKAKVLVGQMTLEEKAGMTLGSASTNGCSGFIGGVPRVGFPGLCLNDAENGVRGGELVSGFPAQLHVGASWNRDLAGQRALYLGQEFKAKGINVILGPVAGPLGRMATGGRNWEGFSNDPYLSGSLIYPSVVNLQKSVIACGKHFIAYEQESNRSPFLAGIVPGLLGQSYSSNLDDRTMHELYLWPFYDMVRAEVGSMMCSYNRVNNSGACQNSKTLNGLLKTELGFQGFVTSDWYGTLTGVAGINAGLDVSMPSSQYLSPQTLAQAVRNGSVNASRLDDQATRVAAAMYRFAEFGNPGLANYANVDAQDPDSVDTLVQSAIEGNVLVKNVNGALPLDKPATLNLFGWDAVGGSNTSQADSFAFGFALANTRQFQDGAAFTDLEIAGGFLSILPDPHFGPTIALDGTIHVGGGSGGTTPNHVTAPYDAFVTQSKVDNTTLYTDFTSMNPKVQAPNAPCLVFINAQSSESWDRSSLSDSRSDTLVENVASQCSNTIVVVHNAGINIIESWIENPNVTAVIYGHLPGQQSGDALADILYGRQSPSGRLPYTVAKQESDYGPLLSPAFPTAQNPLFPQSNFSEGVFIDYRYFIQQGITPRFEFGYGLTYSNFTYSNLQVLKNSAANTAALPYDRDTTSVPQGGLDSLYDTIATVTVDVENTGNTAAAEVAQLYVGIPNSGVPKALRGFDKQLLQPGESATFTFPLRRRDMSVWSTSQQQWVLNSGTYQLMAGKSVLDIQLQSTMSL